MKKVAFVVALVLLFCAGGQAAVWPEGRSAAQPYSGTPPVDLEKTMGYILLCPGTALPARTFCDALEIYLPREDVELAEGRIRLMRRGDGGKGRELFSIDVADRDSVSIRRLTEEEQDSLMWGGGVCIRARLPKSLEFGVEDYYVAMDEGCFTASGGALKSLTIAKPEAWSPVIRGDYGVSGLVYSDEGAESEKTDRAPDRETTYKTQPGLKDRIDFELILGGRASRAVIYSSNDSVRFAEYEYAQSAHVTGEVIGEDLNWGVVFLDENEEILEAVDLGR